MAVYVSYAGSDNSFQVLTGSEEDPGGSKPTEPA